MAKIYGHDSQYIRRLRRSFFIKWILLIIVNLFLVYLGVFSLRLLLYLPFVVVFWIVIVIIIIYSIISRWRKKEEDGFVSAFRGLRGEDDIFRLLKQLPDTYAIYRNMRFRDNNDIDLIVVGPNGVFTIEVKSHRGVIGYNGEQLTNNYWPFKEKNILSQAMSEALDVHEFLKEKTGQDIFIVPVIVFSSPRVAIHFGQNKIKSVYVIKKDWLLSLIQETPGCLKISQELVESALAGRNVFCA